MDLSTFISGTSLFPILGVLGGIFHSLPYFYRTFCMQTVETLIRRRNLFAASGLGLHCLPMFHKKDVFGCKLYFHLTCLTSISSVTPVVPMKNLSD